MSGDERGNRGHPGEVGQHDSRVGWERGRGVSFPGGSTPGEEKRSLAGTKLGKKHARYIRDFSHPAQSLRSTFACEPGASASSTALPKSHSTHRSTGNVK